VLARFQFQSGGAVAVELVVDVDVGPVRSGGQTDGPDAGGRCGIRLGRTGILQLRSFFFWSSLGGAQTDGDELPVFLRNDNGRACDALEPNQQGAVVVFVA